MLVTWASLLVVVAITGVGWLMGKPLTPELMAALGLLTTWAGGTGISWKQRLTDHNVAVERIAQSQGVSPGRVETEYALVERQIEQVKITQALPPGRRDR